MSTQAVQRIPEDMHTVTPHIVCADAVSAIDFYVKAFGATDTGKMLAPNGKLIHGMIRIGDSAIMLAEETPEWGSIGPLTLKGSPVTLHLYVQDADAAFQRAIDAGATAVMPPADMFWGDRYGVVKDPYGHSWSIAHHVRDMTMEEMQEGAAKACGEPGA
ncbi:VOC family protein [Massilia pseudoviolaceinigra]|uniref:VOC family protein n=1 Tax=Massilia pseudoviolaceinigra TaxID=3057165 RepID=UPI0027964C52|nr:VOC family protein [Massilia sp. CCM 9206]MDQ1924240.1 VOC family protein [Massilia sp. CCM 9206]